MARRVHRARRRNRKPGPHGGSTLRDGQVWTENLSPVTLCPRRGRMSAPRDLTTQTYDPSCT